MDIKKRTLTTTEESVIKYQLLVDIDSWVTSAVNGKINNCKKGFPNLLKILMKNLAEKSLKSYQGLSKLYYLI